MPEFNVGDRVMVKGERGTYVVQRSEPYSDGSILVYGGGTNPNARQRFRNVMPANLKVDDRKLYRKDETV